MSTVPDPRWLPCATVSTDQNLLSRRTLLIGGGALLALAIGGTAGCTGDDDGVGDPDPGVLAIGRAYLDQHPEETIASLRAELPPPDPDALTAATERVSDEFRSGATLTIDGWVLAESEAKAAAVLALECDGDGC